MKRLAKEVVPFLFVVFCAAVVVVVGPPGWVVYCCGLVALLGSFVIANWLHVGPFRS